MNHLLDHRIIVWGHSWCEGIFSTSFNVIHSLFLSDTNGILMITCLVTISKTKVNWKKITYPHSLIRDNNMSPSKLLKLNFSYLLKDKDRMQLTRYWLFLFRHDWQNSRNSKLFKRKEGKKVQWVSVLLCPFHPHLPNRRWSCGRSIKMSFNPFYFLVLLFYFSNFL